MIACSGSTNESRLADGAHVCDNGLFEQRCTSVVTSCAVSLVRSERDRAREGECAGPAVTCAEPAHVQILLDVSVVADLVREGRAGEAHRGGGVREVGLPDDGAVDCQEVLGDVLVREEVRDVPAPVPPEVARVHGRKRVDVHLQLLGPRVAHGVEDALLAHRRRDALVQLDLEGAEKGREQLAVRLLVSDDGLQPCEPLAPELDSRRRQLPPAPHLRVGHGSDVVGLLVGPGGAALLQHAQVLGHGGVQLPVISGGEDKAVHRREAGRLHLDDECEPEKGPRGVGRPETVERPPSSLDRRRPPFHLRARAAIGLE